MGGGEGGGGGGGGGGREITVKTVFVSLMISSDLEFMPQSTL